MNDVSGRLLKIGDTVATTFEGRAHLELANITSFTPMKIGVVRESTGFYYTKFPRQVSLVESV